MASNINATNIDITFPIAGQDNDTQGFRTNFTTIQQNFNIAATEISQLQSNSSSFLSSTTVPVSLSASGTPGQIAYDNNYFYVCTATNTWTKIPNTTGTGSFANLTTTQNLITANITSVAGTGGNITIDPDGVGDVVFPVQTEIYVYSNAISAVTVTGGMSLGNAMQFANLTTVQINAITPTNRGMTVYNYNSGNIQVYNGTKWANVVLS